MKKLFIVLVMFLGVPIYASTPVHPSYIVEFEGDNEVNTSYPATTVGLGESFAYPLNWSVGPEALIGTSKEDKKNGSRSARIRLNEGVFGSLTMTQEKMGGIGTISLQYARSGFLGDQTGISPVFVVEYSSDSGGTWSIIGDPVDTAGVDTLTAFTATVDEPGDNIRVRIRQTAGDAGKSFNVDDILITSFIENTNPKITFTAPTKISTFAITDTTVQITDNDILATNILISTESITGGFSISNINCIQISSQIVNCTLQIDAIVGSGQISVVATDSGGNIETAIETGFIITSVTSTPTIPPDLQESSDTGVSNVDNTTNTLTPSFDILCISYSSVILYVDELEILGGETETCSDTGTLTLTPILSDGIHNITFTQKRNLVDIQPFFSEPSPSLLITIDTAISTPTINAIAVGDNVIRGTGEVGAMITIANKTCDNVVEVDSIGGWSCLGVSPRPVSGESIVVTATDLASNTAMATYVLKSISRGGGSGRSRTPSYKVTFDDSTMTSNISTVLVTGEVSEDAPDLVQVTIDKKTYEATMVVENKWTVTVGPLSNGTYDIVVYSEWSDKNDDASGTVDVKIDTQIVPEPIKPELLINTLNEEELCPDNQLLTQSMKAGDRNNIYSSWQQGKITEVKILQVHMNRLGFNAGIIDGILGPITDGAIKRMQTFLGTISDGYVGANTRALINKSCSKVSIPTTNTITSEIITSSESELRAELIAQLIKFQIQLELLLKTA
jgi:hypothetical protein